VTVPSLSRVVSPTGAAAGRPFRHDPSMRPLGRLGAPLVASLVAVLLSPLPAGAHQLVGRLESPLPLWAYLGGAALAVALSFAFVFAREIAPKTAAAPRTVRVSRWVRWPLRAIGLVGWGWVLVQALAFPGQSDADVSALFLWVYGWVGIALVSALIGPAWAWLDPFTSFHDGGAWLLRRLGVRGWAPAAWPNRLGVWPATLGYAFFVWLELIVTGGGGGRILGMVLLGYTAYALLGMAQFGKDGWRAHGEVFSVWFGTLGRFAPIALDARPEDARVRLRGWGAGLLEPGWTAGHVALVTTGVVGVIFDGISQTQAWVDVFGLPSLPLGTLVLAVALGWVAAIALGVARLVGGGNEDRAAGRRVGLAALGAGLTPIAVGYITAHYLTFLLVDGQRIVVAVSDPFQQGSDLFGTAFYTPTSGFLSPALVWIVQLGAVVGGHMVGAWFGHVAASTGGGRGVRARQLPLAALMVVLTVTTLWSLGQAIVSEPAARAEPTARAEPAARAEVLPIRATIDQ